MTFLGLQSDPMIDVVHFFPNAYVVLCDFDFSLQRPKRDSEYSISGLL